MISNSHHWLENLTQLFAATVNQQTLEEAADLMASVSANDEQYHHECLDALDHAIEAADHGDPSVSTAINHSGYQVMTTDAAANLLRSFRTIYLTAYDRERSP